MASKRTGKTKIETKNGPRYKTLIGNRGSKRKTAKKKNLFEDLFSGHIGYTTKKIKLF